MDEPVPYNLDILEFSLEDRRNLIGEHDEEMMYIYNLLHSFVADVNHAYGLKMSPSIVSHLAYNLILTLANGLTDLTVYEYLRGAYLLDDEYDTVYDIWIKFTEEFKVAYKLLESLVGFNYFDSEDDKEKFLEDILPPGTETLKSNRSLVNLERRLASINGVGLLNTLEYCLITMYNWLTDLKNGNYKGLSTDYDKIYEANYRLYRKTYWPREEKIFRKYVETIKPRSEGLNQSFLEKCLQEEKKDFLHTPVGVLWSEYGDDKKELYFEAKRIKLSEEQWKYYFKCICRFEEYERWIDELKAPQPRSTGFRQYVIKPEKADVIVNRIKELANPKDKPRSIMMPIRAAIDAGAIERPNWDSFLFEFGENKLKSKASFTNYTDPMKQPYDDEGYNTLKKEFERLNNE